MHEEIIEAISKNSCYSTDEVERVYKIFKSYDLLVKACSFSAKSGYSNLECACLLVNAKESQEKVALLQSFFGKDWQEHYQVAE